MESTSNSLKIIEKSKFITLRAFSEHMVGIIHANLSTLVPAMEAISDAGTREGGGHPIMNDVLFALQV
jgi:hypothetical protein